MDFIKIQKSRYLKNETFFLPIKKNCQLHIKGYFMAKNSFVAEVTFNNLPDYVICNILLSMLIKHTLRVTLWQKIVL